MTTPSGMRSNIAGAALLNLAEAKPFLAAVVAGGGSMWALGLPAREAVQFGAVTALAVSMGDAVLTGLGVMTKVESYLPGSVFGTGKYMDPMDFLGGAAGMAVLEVFLGMQGRPLAIGVALGAVAGGVAPTIGAYVFKNYDFTNSPI